LKALYLTISVFVLTLTSAEKLFAQINQQDSVALIEFYNNTNINNLWRYKWNTAMPVRTWYGITVENNRVTKIQLRNNILFGSIPASIEKLTMLRELNLSNNWITDTLPASIGNLEFLETFVVGGTPNGDKYVTYLEGKLPATIGKLTNLKTLIIHHTRIADTIPFSLGSLTRLEYLDLSTNQLSGPIPASFGNLVNLVFLKLNCGTDYLERYGGGNINGMIPETLGNLKKLRTVDISGNKITGNIPTSLAKLDNLVVVRLLLNQLNGEIPHEFGDNPYLKSLDLSDNLLSGSIPVSFNKVSKIQTLNLQNNHLDGKIPDIFQNLSFLDTLNLNHNSLTDSIPSSLGKATSLKYLDLSFNKLKGAIPVGFKNLSSLSSLILSNNELSGDIVLPMYGYIKEIDLGHNFFTGTIPLSIQNYYGISLLDLQYNYLSGSIPAFLGGIFSLNKLFLNNNQLTDTLPVFTRYPTYMTIDNNRLSFNGLEYYVLHVADTAKNHYSPQANIKLRFNDGKLSVAAGGTSSNNTYKWYKAGEGLKGTITGDSSYQLIEKGSYYAEITNALVSALTLHTDTLTLNEIPVILCPPLAEAVINTHITGTGYQWQIDTGTGFINVTDDAHYSGAQKNSLELKDVPSAWYGYRFRCATNINDEIRYSIPYKLQFLNTWTGMINDRWEEPLNWSCSHIPDENTDVIVNTGNITINVNTTCRSIKLNTGAVLKVAPGIHLTVRY